MEEITLEEAIECFIENTQVSVREKIQFQKLLQDKWIKRKLSFSFR